MAALCSPKSMGYQSSATRTMSIFLEPIVIGIVRNRLMPSDERLNVLGIRMGVGYFGILSLMLRKWL